MFAQYVQDLRQEFAGYSSKTLKKDLLSGINVAAVALPLSLAFGVASGADAAAGLVTAIFAGLIIGVLG
ncbi:MAG: SulP family inorganic anion transporter, partial [Sphaerochaetaceae bacterium]